MSQQRQPQTLKEDEKISLLVNKDKKEKKPCSAAHYNTNAYGEIKFSGSTKAKV